MTQQDTITIPRDLGEWIIALIRAAPAAASHSRYTPAAAIGEIEKATAAKPEPDLDPHGRIEALEGRCAQLARHRDEALALVSMLRQELSAAKALCGEAAADIEDRDAELASRAEVIRLTKALLHEARAKVDILTANGLEADVDKLEAEIAITPEEGDAIAARLASQGYKSGERGEPDEWLDGCTAHTARTFTAGGFSWTVDRRQLVAPLTPATTPEQDAGF